MNRLRCATHTVTDPDATAERFARWMDYRPIEKGFVSKSLAEAWRAPASVDEPYVLCQPASGAEVFLRFVGGPPVVDYAPIRSHGWAAIEICVQDVLAVNTRLEESPFEVIGPPNRIPGLTTIFPMQVRGPDLETVYLTEILDKSPEHGLPSAGSMIDKPFILVLACADLRATSQWFRQALGVVTDDPMAIRYTMISKSFGLPMDSLHEIVTARDGHEVFLELDQYPCNAPARKRARGALPPGISICTLVHPDIDSITAPWISAPRKREGRLYGDCRVGMLRTPEDALIEIVDGA